MLKQYKKNYRKLDNVAKIFSLDDKKNYNTFRLSAVLKDSVNSKILELALIKTFEMYPSYKVKIEKGFFWNYFSINSKDPIVEEENETPCKSIRFSKNNDYLLKVTYFRNSINLDVFHVLSDGVGAMIFFKGLLYNYIDLKYNLESSKNENFNSSKIILNEHYKNTIKKSVHKKNSKKPFLIKDKSNISTNKTFHYILNLKTLKEVCKKYHVSMTQYLTAIYILAIYKTLYDSSSNKDITITVPIDLRNHYQVQSFSNFFTYMTIDGNVLNCKDITFKQVLKQVHNEFKNKFTLENVDEYFARDIKLGNNITIGLIPLFIKKPFMKYFGRLVNNSSTSTLSNIGQVKVDEKYKKYIENIIALVNPGKIQKIKCTVCSYENNLTVTINSNLIDDSFEKEFYNLLEKYIGKVHVEDAII